MHCPFCKKDDTKVLESRTTLESMRRRRECKKCAKRFTTYERVEATNIMVVKRDGRREHFNREKLKNGLMKACQKRPVSVGQVEKAIDYIETQLTKRRSGEVTTKALGQLVMARLKRIDKVAYIRFASIYRDFKDPEDFESALQEVLRKRS